MINFALTQTQWITIVLALALYTVIALLMVWIGFFRMGRKQ